MTRMMLRAVPVIVLVFLANACSTFTLVHTDFKVKGKTLAVIAGLDNEANEATALFMTEALKKYSRFQVMPQKQVAKSLPGYPATIQGPYKSAYFEIDIDYTKTDLKKIKAIQQKLGVDYLYVMWTPIATVTNGKIHQLHVVAQMFEAPGKEVGNGRFAATAGHTDCCLVPAPNDADKTNAIRDTAERVAKEIAEKTGMKK